MGEADADGARPRPPAFERSTSARHVDPPAVPSTTQRTWRHQSVARGENMRFLSMIRVEENIGQVPSEQLMQDMMKLIEETTREGTLIRTAGLRPTKEGVRVQLRKGGKLSTVDGPFTETKEVIGGFAILEAKSMAEAIEMTRRFL